VDGGLSSSGEASIGARNLTTYVAGDKSHGKLFYLRHWVQKMILRLLGNHRYQHFLLRISLLADLNLNGWFSRVTFCLTVMNCCPCG
jgi:hypothetical protein